MIYKVFYTRDDGYSDFVELEADSIAEISDIFEAETGYDPIDIDDVIKVKE